MADKNPVNPTGEADASKPKSLEQKPSLEEALGHLDGIFNTYEVRILGVMGLLIGYICVFFAKIMYFTNIYSGVCGIAMLTMLLLMINKNFHWKSGAGWLRSILVVFICLLLTAPQLYFAWHVSVSEVRAALDDQKRNEAERLEKEKIRPEVTISNEP